MSQNQHDADHAMFLESLRLVRQAQREKADAEREERAAGKRRKRKLLNTLSQQRQLTWASDLVKTEGGLLTNRPPVNRNGGSEAESELPDTAATLPHRSTGGEDRFEVAAYVRWERAIRFGTVEGVLQAVEWSDSWDSLRAKLESCLAAYNTIKQSGDESLRPQTYVAGWAVSAGGRVGGERKGPVYRYRLEAEGVVLLVADRRDWAGTFANVRIQIESMPLICDDARHVWARVVEEVEGLGGTIDIAKPSRVDVCVDLPGVDVEEFTTRLERGQFLSRAKAKRGFGLFEIHGVGMRRTGLSMGSGIMLRIYDKIEECQRNPIKLAAMKQHRYDGVMPEVATRCEFQIRREELKSLKFDTGKKDEKGNPILAPIDTMEDWFKARASVCAYLVEKWVRFTESEPDRKNGNQAKAVVAAVWLRVREKFTQWVGAPLLFVTRSAPPVRIDAKQLRAQFLGVLSSMWAWSKKFGQNVAEFKTFASDLLGQCLEERNQADFWKRTFRKRSRFLASVPDGFGWVDEETDSQAENRERIADFLSSFAAG